MPSFARLFGPVVLVAALVGCAAPGAVPEQGAYPVDEGGRPVAALEVGSSLRLAARGLRPRTPYDIRLELLDHPAAAPPLSFARLGTDADGRLEPFHLWFQSGVVGCSLPPEPAEPLPPFMFRSFDDAERALVGRRLAITLTAVDRDDPITPTARPARAPEARLEVPVIARRSPLVYPSDSEGCLRNSRLAESADMHVSGHGFQPGERVEISVVPNQRDWLVGDPVGDVTGVGGRAAPVQAQADSLGRLTVRVWDKMLQRRGAYDIVAQRHPKTGAAAPDHLDARSIVSFASETAYLLFLRYPPNGPLMDVAGRQLNGFPYFEFADSFAETADPVWGAVDPTYVPKAYLGGRYAAYYVVEHRDVKGWDPAAGGATKLKDRSDTGPEVVPIKAGCINGTDVKVWKPPLKPGAYDLVVNFGSKPAQTAAAFKDDKTYDRLIDFLDGADQVGFVVASDPYEFGKIPIGRSTYGKDDFIATLGSAKAVDLRAVVRYPATTSGDDTPVAKGTHPLFIIQHGNHGHCEVCQDNAGKPVACTQSMYAPSSCKKHIYPHHSCPQRKPNHLGYMRLLDILASHGIIAVSIDAYDLTGSWCIGVQAWIPERGDLILKHLELWSHMNDPSTYGAYPDLLGGRFKSSVDMTKLAVSGHSRGGEAAVAAYLRNTAFKIGSVSSIAPVDFQVYTLPDVPYFVVLPAADLDVSDLHGARIYDRAGAKLASVDATTKSGIYVYGANHSFFNTVWADDGDESWIPRDDYIPKAKQQKLGETYLAAFARVHLLDESVYTDMLRGRLTFPSTAGLKVLPMHHEKSHAKLEDGTVGGTPKGGATTSSVSAPSVHSTEAARVGWSANGAQLTFTVPVKDRDASTFEVLSFRVAQTNSSTNPAASQEFQVELVGGGKAQAVYTGRFDAIPKPYDRKNMFGNEATDHNVMTTVRIPLQAFIANKSGVKLTSIDTVRFRFVGPSKGEIYVDDLEFSR